MASATEGFTYVKTNEPTPTAGDNTYSATSNTIYISGVFLTDGLYVVRVKSVNPLNTAGAPSGWSAVVGTGEGCGRRAVLHARAANISGVLQPASHSCWSLLGDEGLLFALMSLHRYSLACHRANVWQKLQQLDRGRWR